MSHDKELQLWQAATSGDPESVAKLLETFPKIDVNWVGGEKGDAAIHRACRFGHTYIARLLLGDPRTQVEKGNAGGAPPFKIACQEGHADIVGMMLSDPRINVNLPARSGCTPISIACETGQTEVVHLLLGDPRTDVNFPDQYLTSPLWIAAQNGHIEAAQALLASEKPVVTSRKSRPGQEGWNGKTASEIGRYQASLTRQLVDTDDEFRRKKTLGPVISDLIDSYEKNPDLIRNLLRTFPGIRGSWLLLLLLPF